MTDTFKDYVLKFTRGSLQKYIKEHDFTTRNSKAKILNYLHSQEAPKEVIDDFRKIWEEYVIIKN